MSEAKAVADFPVDEVRNLSSNFVTCFENESQVAQSMCSLSLNQLSELVLKTPNEIIIFILEEKCGFLSLFKEIESKQEFISYAIIALGKASSSDLHKYINKLLLTISSDIKPVLINVQRYLVFLGGQDTVEKCHIDSLFYLIIFLRNFQLILPSSSLDFISMILPLATKTCKKHFKDQELGIVVFEKLKEIDDEQNLFMKHYSVFEVKNASEKEKLQLLEPPESFRSLSVTPTVDDILLPCSFLRPNITKGKYKSSEHYLDVQFRLLREDYLKPLRDGIIEYLCLKKNNKPVTNCKSVQVYTDVHIVEEEFSKGSLIHTVKFSNQNLSSINWENSNRFINGNLLCLSSNDFHNILFASVYRRDIDRLKKGLLSIQFEENSGEVLNFSQSVNFVMIETSAYFGSYCHNLKVLQTLNADLLPMKRYIIDVEKTINNPQYLKPTTTFDMRPLLLPKHIYKTYIRMSLETARYIYPHNIINISKSITVIDDNSWPSASELNLDQSQLNALKLAITKEFAIIQGPPGTGKTYVGLRVVQLLLHNIKSWFRPESNEIPILIVCYTNHALDQFLEGVLLFTKKIVRIGGRGTNEKIAKYQIGNLVKSNACVLSELKNISDTIKAIYCKLNKISESIEISTKCLIEQSDIEGCIPSVHLKSLKKGDFKVNAELRDKTATIAHWLEAVKSDKTLSKEKISIKAENFKELVVDLNNSISKTESTKTIAVGREEDGYEGDIEFIENQRDIDFGDLRESVILRKLDNSQFKENNNLDLDYVRSMLERNIAMKEHQAKKIKNIWSLHIKIRWQLYKYWLNIFIEKQQKEYLRLQAALKKAFKQQSDLRSEQDFSVIRYSHVVGLTTTGAAKYRHIIDALKPAILIVEEAAEILESHIVTSLTPEIQHVILIGDQQQLRPSPSVHILGVKYGMNVSLFERMIKNGLEYCRLSIQHRMRPEIASLIVPHIYSDLKNHEVVTKFDHIKGVGKSVFFISHNFAELPAAYSKSKVNEHEAKFLIELCKYLLYQGYKPSQITVLTTYSGQLFALKRLARDEVKEIRFTVVDNFQGEENDIILISFVRSNDEGQVGFLKVSNRVCVALSRAKKGLYCIGNFELLAQKSNLWKNIVGTLNKSQSIGLSLQLVCQNHPSAYHEVVNDTDFSAVPEGGCGAKCNYRLSCGHSCTLFCHPYDKDHKLFKCLKPCNTVCEFDHRCLKKCSEVCGSCPVMVDKTLSLCGHTVRAECGFKEEQIKCPEPCKKTCDKGHKCLKQCFRDCKPCPVIIDKTLKCGHIVPAKCGLMEDQIKCHEPCNKTCDKGHKCLKKCFKNCKPCPVIVDKTLPLCRHTVPAECGLDEWKINCPEPCTKTCDKGHKCLRKCFECCEPCSIIIDKTLKCGHTVPAECRLSEYQIKCPEPCNKTCDKGHKCQKKCFECCKPCPIIIDKTLKCGHTVPAQCGLSEYQIKCPEPCNKTCKKGHKCHKKCSELCGSCKTLVDKILDKCNHAVKIECGLNDLPLYLLPLHKRLKCKSQCTKICSKGHQCPKLCYEICGSCTTVVSKTLPHCGHTVEMPCSQDESKVICKKKCSKVLSCGHECSNRCMKPCVVKCMQEKMINSSICGHVLKVTCGFTESFEKLQRICTKPCGEVLPCGHICKGNCGDCYQGRLHIECLEPCERILICGHKCSSECSKSCPPCDKPCENKCSHSRCSRKCGSPCVKCYKKCDWSCSHKKCTRRCFEICDREPCNKPCMKILPCNHQCIGFCGEPCPKQCPLCSLKVSKEDCYNIESNKCRLIYLEDCKHLIKEQDLDKWFNSDILDSQNTRMKTCPKCGTVIRKNVRFNKLIKTCIANIEKIKLIAVFDKEENFEIQKSLSRNPVLSYINTNQICKPLIEDIISYDIENIQELLNIGNLVNFVGQIELKRFSIFSMFALNPFLKSLVQYARFCRTWLSEFIANNFFTVSEYQLVQLSVEVYRLCLIDLLLNFASKKFFISHSPDFENCVRCVLNFKPLTKDNIKEFENLFQNMVKNLVHDQWEWVVPSRNSIDLVVVNMSGYWYHSSNGSITCFIYKDLLPNENLHDMHNMPHGELSSSSLSTQELLQEKYERLYRNTFKQVCTSTKAKSTSDQSTEESFSELGILRESSKFLSSLLLKKLNNMHKVDKRRFDKYPANKNTNISKVYSQTSAYQKSTEKQITKLQLSKEIDQKKYDRSYSKERSYRKNMSASGSQEKVTGVNAKQAGFDNGSHHTRKDQNKSVFNPNFRNTSKYLTKDNTYTSNREGPMRMFEHMAANKASAEIHERVQNQKPYFRSQSQSSLRMSSSLNSSIHEYSKESEEDNRSQKYFLGLRKNETTTEIATKMNSNPEAHWRQIVKYHTHSSSNKYEENAVNSAVLNKPLKEGFKKLNHKNESLSNDLEKTQNATENHRLYQGQRGNRGSRRNQRSFFRSQSSFRVDSLSNSSMYEITHKNESSSNDLEKPPNISENVSRPHQGQSKSYRGSRRRYR